MGYGAFGVRFGVAYDRIQESAESVLHGQHISFFSLDKAAQRAAYSVQSGVNYSVYSYPVSVFFPLRNYSLKTGLVPRFFLAYLGLPCLYSVEPGRYFSGFRFGGGLPAFFGSKRLAQLGGTRFKLFGGKRKPLFHRRQFFHLAFQTFLRFLQMAYIGPCAGHGIGNLHFSGIKGVHLRRQGRSLVFKSLKPGLGGGKRFRSRGAFLLKSRERSFFGCHFGPQLGYPRLQTSYFLRVDAFRSLE